LRDQVQRGRQQELVLAFEAAEAELKQLKTRQQHLSEKEIHDSAAIKDKETILLEQATRLQTLQDSVKALGEDQLLSVQAELAGLDPESRSLERQATQHQQEGERLQGLRHNLTSRRHQLQADSESLKQANNPEVLQAAEQACRDAEAAVEISRRRLGDVAGRSGAWLDEQRQRAARRSDLQTTLTPLQEEQQQLQERLRQDEARQSELQLERDEAGAEDREVQDQLEQLEQEWQSLLESLRSGKELLQERAEAVAIQQRTRTRLEEEQTRLEREIARLESRREALQETRGTGALRLLLEAGLDGIHGAVAQLGEVEDRHRLALEVAAGARMAQVVVDDDRIAARAIDLLKSRRAGRLTFLPLNKIRSQAASGGAAMARGRRPDGGNGDGLIGRAVELIRFEPIYSDVFGYVFGDTQVFSDLGSARQQLGRFRAVTLEGELLEKSGAMTGGSFSQRSGGLSFGVSSDNDEAEPLRQRLLELGETLAACRREESRLLQSLEQQRPLLRQLEQRQAALDAERTAAKRAHGPLLERCRQRTERLHSLQANRTEQEQRLQVLKTTITPLLDELERISSEERKVQAEADAGNWQQLQGELEQSDNALEQARRHRDERLQHQRERELAQTRIGDQQQAIEEEENSLQLAVTALAESHQRWRDEQKELEERRQTLESQQQILQTKFGEERRARDAAEASVAELRQNLQQARWELERLQEERQAIQEQLRSGGIRLEELKPTLPNPLPEIPEEIRNAGLEALQDQLQQLLKRMEALEPVNMLALEELTALEERLGDLGERLDVLSQEREELLLRIETVATLRQEAFMEAFQAVDGHFSEIFASLSEGDGKLQLDNPDDPLEGGLTLVAHPKGKAVRRLAAMSGGEKSLTALSFLFALQRFRPSPFYALDEVDSFLDGVNVERLAALIARQAEQAQFLVVSHRRPMIGASQRTIGVTQARGAHTQVVGLPDAA
jgi:chromosome segregation protein